MTNDEEGIWLCLELLSQLDNLIKKLSKKIAMKLLKQHY